MRANCVICSDFFDEITQVSAAPCGHVYHSNCLSLWIAQSQTCPQCRSRITQKNILKLYFNFPPASVTNSSELENEVLNLKAQISAKNIELQACKKEKEDTIAFVRLAEKKAEELQQTAYKNESEISELRLRVKSYSKLESRLLKLEQMNVALTNDIQHLHYVEKIVNGTQKDVENILQEYNNSSEATKQLATYCTCLKRELQKVIESKTKLFEQNSKLKRENGVFAAKVKFYEDAMATPSSKVGRSVLKETSPLSDKCPLSKFSQNDSPVSSRPTSSMQIKSADDSMNISPLTVSFDKPKYNVCFKTSTKNVAVNIKSRNVNMNITSNPSLSLMKQNNDSSIIRTGYNGLGGHSNFINSTSGYKKALKRKA